MSKVSPLAPDGFPEMPAIAGVRLAVGECGAPYKGRTDLLLVELAAETKSAGVLTRSRTASAPVEWCRRVLGRGDARGLLVNAGNANAFTGRAGVTAVERTAGAAAHLLDCEPGAVFLASTGVIGEALADEKITAALSGLGRSLGEGGWEDAARAMGTTDTFPKGATRSATIGGGKVVLNGIAKGSGMIAPDMATLLAFVFTDAAIPSGVLQQLLEPAADRSFNAITVDGDTSTSDTLLLFATGAADHDPVKAAGEMVLADFRAKLEDLLMDLAHQVVRDGEGASKFIAITVSGAENDRAARRIGFSIGNSPLVKTAIAGEDANWGRIVMAVGKAGEQADRDRLAIQIGGFPVAHMGVAVPGYDEAPVARHMKGSEIEIVVDVGIGAGRATIWTCDLTHGYIEINADYRS